MKFGLALPQYDYSLPSQRTGFQQIKDIAQQAEELGYSSVWLSDHLFLDLERYGGDDTPQSAMECFTTMAALTAVTTRVRIGSLVVCNDLRHPALVAKMAASMDVLSGGRIEIGMGAGWYEREYAAAGISFDPAGVRVSRLAEAVQIVRGMLGNASFSYSGKYYSVKDAVNLPRPVQQPLPVTIGGKGDRVVRLAGRYADGYNAVWTWSPETFAGRLRLLDQAAERAGRLGQVRKSVGLYTVHGRSPSELEKRWALYAKAAPGGASADLPSGDDRLVGTTDQVVDRVQRFSELGVEEVILGFGTVPFQIADPSAIAAFAEEVFPKVQTS